MSYRVIYDTIPIHVAQTTTQVINTAIKKRDNVTKCLPKVPGAHDICGGRAAMSIKSIR